MIFSNEQIENLKNTVKQKLTPFRYLHTLGVAEAAKDLSRFCLPEYSYELEAAALLHDITKEYSREEQLEIIKNSHLDLTDEDMESPQVWHSFTAKTVILKEYAEFATENILSAVYNHTLGDPNMTVFDEIIFIADFIEENRKYDSSVRLRKYVYENMQHGDTFNNLKILHAACIKSIDDTAEHLKENKRRINSKNILTRNALLSKI